MPHDETRQATRQLIKSLKKYQLNELAMLLAAIHEDDCLHAAAQIVQEELIRADRGVDALSFAAVHSMMVEQH